MSTTRKRPSVRPSRTTLVDVAAPRCECRHRSELDGRCPRAATSRVTVICQVDGCECAAAVHLVCEHCLQDWQRSARLDGIGLKVRAL